MTNALMHRTYGSTGEKVTVIGLGGACLKQRSYTDGVETARRALELGVNYFDTSPAYGTQDILGEALGDRAEPHLLATKLWPNPPDSRSPAALRAQLEENLRLLRRDSVDVLQVHRADFESWWKDGASNEALDVEEDYDFANAPIMQVLHEAKEEGKCRFISITGDFADEFAYAFTHLDVDAVLFAFNYDLIIREARKRVLPTAQERGVALIIGQVFQRRRLNEVHPEWLTAPPDWMTPQLHERFERLYDLQRECGLSLVELTIRYLTADPAISTVLIGSTTAGEIEECIAAAEAGPLPPDLHSAVEELGLSRKGEL